MIGGRKIEALVETCENQEKRARAAAMDASIDSDYEKLLTAYEIAIAGLASTAILMRKFNGMAIPDTPTARLVMESIEKNRNARF